MKQRITVEQLNELSGEQKERLKDLWDPQVGDWYACWNMHTKKYSESLYFVVEEDTYYNNEPDKSEKDLPLFSIGQMIEILLENESFSDEYGCDPMPHFSVIMLDWAGEIDGIELCDALWEAVKKVL